MALKYQFGTSHEDSLTNSKALIQTEKIKANLEIRAKVSMKKPFFFFTMEAPAVKAARAEC